MPKKYHTIYEFINEVERAEKDIRIFLIVKAVDKLYNTVAKNLQRANFKKPEKEAIIKAFKDEGYEIVDEDKFFHNPNKVKN